MLKVHISPKPAENNHGIGRVVHAQYRHLPAFGIELVDNPDNADVIAAHVVGDHLPRIDVLHSHGLYWSHEEGDYIGYHHHANMRIAQAARRASFITVPSEWVAMPFKRDMRISPYVIGHGIDIDLWDAGEDGGYVLWNKNRSDDVCDPSPAVWLAQHVPVISTFGDTSKMRVTGILPHEEMKQFIQCADVYLATTRETFGIGVLEAMACGVPVLGFNWGALPDLVQHGIDGYLVKPNDLDGLLEGYHYIQANRAKMSQEARKTAERYSWHHIMQAYANLYKEAYDNQQSHNDGVTIVITNYNYANYVCGAIDSALKQTHKCNVVVIDDGSTDKSVEFISDWVNYNHPITFIQQQNQGVAAARNAGISATDDPYIICLDADDQLHPDYVATILPHMIAKPQLGIAYAGLMLFKDSGDSHKAGFPPPFDWSNQSHLSNPPANCIPSAAMFSRKMWERAGGIIQQGDTPGEDVEFWTRGLSVGFEAEKVSDKPYFYYRLHEGQAHKTKKYKPIDAYLPWIRDKDYPFAVPANHPVKVRSYEHPAVSVVIPVGPNHGQYLNAALHSLTGQTFREWEAVVINDSGQELPASIWKAFPFIRYAETQGAEGPSKARNMGIDIAKGELILFLDADDWLLPDCLADMIDAYQTGYYVYSDYFETRADGSRHLRTLKPYVHDSWKGQHAVNQLIAKSDCPKFDESMRGWEDWDFALQCAVNGVCGIHVDKPLFVYRFNAGSRRNDSAAMQKTILPILKTRYEKYYTGIEAKAMCGCGSNKKAGQAIIKAKSHINNMKAVIESASLPQEIDTMATVRMEYIGSNKGAISFSRLSNTQLTKTYRGGRNSLYRFVNANPADVPLLVGSGKWKVIPRPDQVQAVVSVPAPVQAVPAPIAETVKAKTHDATARAKALAKSAGIDLGTITGTGKGGKITLTDVKKAVAQLDPV